MCTRCFRVGKRMGFKGDFEEEEEEEVLYMMGSLIQYYWM